MRVTLAQEASQTVPHEPRRPEPRDTPAPAWGGRRRCQDRRVTAAPEIDPSLPPFEQLSLERLRTRTSIKWRMFDPDVLPLWVAEMDALPTPAVARALGAALAEGDTGYPAMGTAYAESLLGVAQRRWGWTFDPALTHTAADVITGVHAALELVTEPGDGVLVPMPVYAPLHAFTALMGRRVVPSPLTDAGRLDLDHIAATLDQGAVRAVLLCSPHNPTGVVHTEAELDALAALAAESGVEVVVDEIHALLVPAGTTFTPYLAVADQGLVVTSASKAYNLAGLKAAVIVAGPGSAHLLERIPKPVLYGTSAFGIVAHRAAWDGGDAWIDAVNANIASNAGYLAELLAEHLPQVGYRPPEATYLAWLDCRALGLGDDPSEAFRERGRVALNPGPEFGVGGDGFVRLNLACSRAVLEEAVLRMAATVG
jgi:cysteine-S-conjugate beta-lyase